MQIQMAIDIGRIGEVGCQLVEGASVITTKFLLYSPPNKRVESRKNRFGLFGKNTTHTSVLLTITHIYMQREKQTNIIVIQNNTHTHPAYSIIEYYERLGVIKL